jgi:hypothetical protein
MRTLELGTEGEGVGYVAGEGLSRAKQKMYAELAEKLRGYAKGSDEHRATRWEMYQLTGGDLPYESWKNVYDANMVKAERANKVVAGERTRLGYPEQEYTFKLKGDEVRRFDIADPAKKKAVEVKAYESGTVYQSDDLRSEYERDGTIVKRGWEITWLFIDCEPSGPLTTELTARGITVEIRLRQGRSRDYVKRIVANPASVVRQ